MKLTKRKIIITLCVIFLLLLTFFVFYYLATSKKMYFINDKNLQIPIYTYHQIVESPSEIEIDYMQTTYKNLNKQIDGLIKIGYTPITYQDLVDYKNGEKAIPKRSCIITFDDGYTSVYEYAYPLIKEKNISITLFIVNNLVGTNGYMTWEQLQEMYSSGLVSIYSHGLNHSEYDKLGADVLLAETEESYKNLRKNLNDENILKVFAYPCGFYTEEEIKILEDNGYIQNLMDGKINKSNSLNLSNLHRVYPLNDSAFKIVIKQIYKTIKY